METFKIIVTVICIIAYTIFSVWAIKKINTLTLSIAGSIGLAAGGVGVYFASPFIAIAIAWVFKALLILGAIALVLYLFGG